jgi:hypothetical protein
METELTEAILDLLDMLGALSGGANELHGWGLSEERQQEIWELGQRLLIESQGE